MSEGDDLVRIPKPPVECWEDAKQPYLRETCWQIGWEAGYAAALTAAREARERVEQNFLQRIGLVNDARLEEISQLKGERDTIRAEVTRLREALTGVEALPLSWRDIAAGNRAAQDKSDGHYKNLVLHLAWAFEKCAGELDAALTPPGATDE